MVLRGGDQTFLTFRFASAISTIVVSIFFHDKKYNRLMNTFRASMVTRGSAQALTAQQQKWLDLIETNLQQMQEKK
jgi:hypothetical protein